MSKNPEVHVAKPFGPTIAKVTIPEEMILKLNNYVDDIIKDKNKSEAQDFGGKLVGQVTQEFHLDKTFCETSGWLEFLGKAVTIWIQKTNGKNIKQFSMRESWVVRQFKNEYNPTHWHSGHISGVGYLKVPNSFGSMPQENKKDTNRNGKLELIHGTRQFLSNSLFNVTPKVGDFYFFPNYMMHMVYPFSNTDEERRSISFNADIDENIYNVYS
tara:strand:+ start:301 stop:942 length:642 start_codon:yes stop_codon:yes gene_type:complete